MKFKLVIKDPDGVWGGITDAAKASASEVMGVSEEERDEIVELRRADLDKAVRQWFRYGEVATIEIDTDAKTAVVLPA